MMIGDNHIHTAGVTVINGVVGGDACVTGDDQLRAIIDDGSKRLNVNAVTLLAANGDVMHNVRAEGAKRLHKQCSGCLPIHIEVAPNADLFVGVDSLKNAFDGGFDVWKWCRGGCVGMKEGAG